MFRNKIVGIKKHLKKEIEVNKFKKLVKDMYRGFPNFQYSNEVEKIIVMEEVRDELIKHGFLIKMTPIVNKNGEKLPYMLGPNSLSLVSAWKTEKLTRWVIVLSIISLLTAISTLFF